MWLEVVANVGLGSLSVGIGGGILGCVFYRSELKRLARIAYVEIQSRLPQKRPTIEIALHADLEVDMKWWDEEFSKLQAAIPTRDWHSWSMAELATRVNEATPRYKMSDLTSITDGNLTYYSESPRVKAANMARNAGFLNAAEHVKWIDEEAEDREQRDVTPYGNSYSLRNAQQAGVNLVTACEISARSVRATPGFVRVPDHVFTSALRRIRSAETWDQLVDATLVAQALIKGYADRCEDCEYVEQRSYGDEYAKHQRTRLCWKCEQEKLDKAVVDEQVRALAEEAMSRAAFSLAI